LAEPLAPQRDAASMSLEDEPRTIRLRGSIERADVDAVCVRASRAFATAGPGAIACDLEAVENPTLPIVDVLARLALLGRRSRHRMHLQHASPVILDLLVMCGLDDVLRGEGFASGADESGGEVRR
jgi:hypothetical protein